MCDPALQQQLDRTVLPDAFALEIQAVAAAGVEAERLLPVRRSAPVAGAGIPLSPDWAPPGWLPVRVHDRDDGPVVDWAHFGDSRLDASFYEDSLARAIARPFNRLFRHANGLDDFIAGARPDEAAAVQGFMFHMSRCGSTLAAQMFAALPGAISLSEPGPLDAVVRLAIRGDRPSEWSVAALRAMVAALARRRGFATRCIVKLDSWHILALPLFRRAFPDVPWVYLFREPTEVLVSHMRMRGYQTVPELMPPGLYALEGMSPAEPELLCARILAQFHAAALMGLESGAGIAIDYADLPEAVTERIAPHFGLDLSVAEYTAMREAARRDAKAPERIFAPDAESKRAAASEAVRTAARLHLAELHARLLALRSRATRG